MPAVQGFADRLLFSLLMEEILFSLKHHSRFLNSELLELQGLPLDLRSEAA